MLSILYVNGVYPANTLQVLYHLLGQVLLCTEILSRLLARGYDGMVDHRDEECDGSLGTNPL